MDERARQLVLKHGWNATAYQILNPGIERWFSERAGGAGGVVGFVRRGGTWVVAGAPVCAVEDLRGVVQDFEDAALQAGCRVCYVGAAERLAALLEESRDHARVAIGAQPVWAPTEWETIVRGRRSLRAQLSRARNKGVVVREREPRALREEAALQECLRKWVAARPMPEMHFLVEPETCGGALEDRLLFVAEREGEVVGFLLASPVPTRKGFLVEQIVRPPDAPNGTAELLIDAMMGRLVERGDAYVTMGLVPLAKHAGAEIRRNPVWLRGLMAWARAHGRRFYHFDGLEAFRVKMCPGRWEMIYAISNEERFTMAAFYGLVAAFCEGSVVGMVVRGLGKALGAEVRNVVRMGQRLPQKAVK